LREKLTARSLTADDLHQQLLRVVYCCLFLFVIEDRSQLHPADTPEETRRLWREGYSITQLRARAQRPRLYESYGDLWQGVQVAFLALERGAPEIGAPALGGLFARATCPDLFTASLMNTDLLAAIKALAFFKPDKSKSLARINYRDLNTEELGSVYESLLELHPKLGREPWDFGYFGLNGDAAKGSERKLSGSYYTPSVLVDELIRSALEPVIRKTATDNPYDRRAALLKLKVVDPACGSGHFLLAAARRLAREIAIMDAFPDAPTEVQRQHALRDVVQHCIYGVDRNPLALELCRTALWIETVEPGRPLSFLDHHLRCGDALIGVFDLKVLEAGIPDEAYKSKTGDNKLAAKTLRAQNKAERERPLLKLALGERLEVLGAAFDDLDAMGQDDPAAVEAKAIVFARLTQGTDLHRLKLASDLWTAGFFGRLAPPEPGQSSRLPTTLDVWKALGGADGDLGARPTAASALAHEYRFFHWPLEFPEVFKQGGFDVVIGNPPWEVLQLSEEEFFASRRENICQRAQ
jgi:N-6 DNA Methylase